MKRHFQRKNIILKKSKICKTQTDSIIFKYKNLNFKTSKVYMCIFFYVHKIFYLYFEKYIPKKTQEGILTIL